MVHIPFDKNVNSSQKFSQLISFSFCLSSARDCTSSVMHMIWPNYICVFLSLPIVTQGYTNIYCDSDSPCNNTILLDGTTCHMFCDDGVCTNKTIYFSTNCKYSRFDIGDSGAVRTKVYFSGHFLISDFYNNAPCTDCAIYVGNLVHIISNETDFALSFPNISISQAFNPSLYNFGSKLYVGGYSSSTDNLNIYCIGAVSYCILYGRATFGLMNSILFCDIDEINNITGFYRDNYHDGGDLITDFENNFPVHDWSIKPGCHFDCSPPNGCIVTYIARNFPYFFFFFFEWSGVQG